MGTKTFKTAQVGDVFSNPYFADVVINNDYRENALVGKPHCDNPHLTFIWLDERELNETTGSIYDRGDHIEISTTSGGAEKTFPLGVSIEEGISAVFATIF